MKNTSTDPIRIVLIGPPGSGKGTQAQRLKEAYTVPHVSSGDVLRKEVAERTDLGRKIKSYIDKGEIGPVELITEAILNHVQANCPKGFILDGFPRTMFQAEKLAAMYPLDGAFFISVPEDAVVERITGRRICSQCSAVFHTVYNRPLQKNRCDACGGVLVQRSDDTEETVRNRMRVYDTETKPVIDYYKDRNELVVIDGSGEPDHIFQDILSHINK